MIQVTIDIIPSNWYIMKDYWVRAISKNSFHISLVYSLGTFYFTQKVEPLNWPLIIREGVW